MPYGRPEAQLPWLLVATVRALKYNGGVPKAETGPREPGSSGEGPAQPAASTWSNITKVYKLPCVVAINRFPQDTEAELKLWWSDKCKELGVNVALSPRSGQRAAKAA